MRRDDPDRTAVAPELPDNVVPWRPRSEVPARLERFRSLEPTHSCDEPLPLMIRGDITYDELYRALGPAGLTAKLDARLRAVVIMRCDQKPECLDRD